MSENTPSTGKGRPTPARKQQEAANRKPIVGAKTPEAVKAAKTRAAQERRESREGMLRGEERYLTARDKGPQRRLARDIVDSRFTAGQLVMPALFLMIIISYAANTTVQVFTLLAMWVLFFVIAVDAFFIGRRVEKAIENKFGKGKTEKGVRWYAAMRSIQMRPMRLPKPQVKRGEKVG
jgi:Flp pilus assembly protein TadB